MITRRQISHAYGLISSRLRRTPAVDVMELTALPLTLKLEMLQHTGSFKPRGAFANLLSSDIPSVGRGGRLRWKSRRCGRLCGFPAAHQGSHFRAVENPPCQVALIASHGAEIVQEGDSYAAAFELCERYADATGAMLVHAYDSELTISGQGTLALELEEQAPDLDTVLVAVGGGGLIAGVAAWYSSGLKIVSVEPESSPTMERALAAGRPVDISPSGIAADSLGASRIGAIPFSFAQSYVDSALLVSEQAIRRRKNGSGPTCGF